MSAIAFSEQDRNMLIQVRKELEALKGLMKQSAEVWLKEADVIRDYDISAKTLQRMRANGEISGRDWRSRGGKNFQYKKSAIENLYS